MVIKFENENQNYLNRRKLGSGFNRGSSVFVHNEIINEDIFSSEFNELLESFKNIEVNLLFIDEP